MYEVKSIHRGLYLWHYLAHVRLQPNISMRPNISKHIYYVKRTHIYYVKEIYVVYKRGILLYKRAISTISLTLFGACPPAGMCICGMTHVIYVTRNPCVTRQNSGAAWFVFVVEKLCQNRLIYLEGIPFDVSVYVSVWSLPR